MSKVILAAIGLFALGCGADCAEICEKQKSCAGADQSVQCEAKCESDEQKAEAAGCENQYEDALSCKDDQKDVCKIEEACRSEENALLVCIAK